MSKETEAYGIDECGLNTTNSFSQKLAALPAVNLSMYN